MPLDSASVSWKHRHLKSNHKEIHMQIELSKVKALLSSVNPRSEIHGEEKMPAGDLKLRVNLSNDCLAMLHPTLKAMLYHYDKQIDADLVDTASASDPAYAPHLRFPEIPAINWKGEMVGAQVIAHIGIDDKSNIVLHPCTVNNLVLEPQQGGTVKVSFRVQAHPDEKQFGKLCGLIGTEIDVSVVPPKAEEGLV